MALARTGPARTSIVSDPEELKRYGFEAGTILLANTESSVIHGPSGGPVAAESSKGKIAGKKAKIEYVDYDGAELRPLDSEIPTSSGADRSYLAMKLGGNPLHRVQLQLPHGSTFDGVRWWAVNNRPSGDPDGLLFRLYRHELPPAGPGPTVTTILGAAAMGATPGPQSGFIPASELVDTASMTFSFEVEFQPFFAPGFYRFQRVRAQYRRA